MKSAKSGKLYFKAGAIHNKDNGDDVWVELMCFGSQAQALYEMLKKGSILKVTGSVKSEEKPDKSGDGVRVFNTLFVDEAVIPTKNGLVTVDEFWTDNGTASSNGPTTEPQATTDRGWSHFEKRNCP